MTAFYSYYDNNGSTTPYSRQHHYYPTLPTIMGDQNVALFGYAQAGYGLIMYSRNFVPMCYIPFVPCDDSWIMNSHEEEQGAEGDYYDQFITPCDDSWILNAPEEEEEEEEESILTEEELHQFDLIDEEVVVYDSTHDDDGMSEETIAKHLNTRNHHHEHHPVDAHNICVVCQDSLFQKDEKIATLACGHDFHEGCIKSWLMLKNSCPLCKATGIRL